ncbi:MAG: MBL fold metallo-hydrolase [Clostridia bacterium]
MKESADNKALQECEPQPRHRRWLLICMLFLMLVAVFSLSLLGYSQRIAATNAAPTPIPTETLAFSAGNHDFTGLTIWFLDIGQGDCAFLRSPNGKTMLIDAGPAGSFPVIQRFLEAQQITRLDIVICSHLHADHIGSMTEILDAYQIGALYLPPFDIESSTYANLVEAVERNHVLAKPIYASATSTLDWDETTEVRVLSPYEVHYDDENDTSLMLRIRYGNTAALFVGDAGLVAERLAIKALPNHYFTANVLKVGHHGSASATGKKFLSTVKPSIAVISVGKDNSYNLPDASILKRLKQTGIKTLRTDELGTICISLDGNRAWVIES